jgi:hypothetical protein
MRKSFAKKAFSFLAIGLPLIFAVALTTHAEDGVSTSSNAACPVNIISIDAQARLCEQSGGKPVIKEENGCRFFKECAKRTEEKKTEQKLVGCKKTTDGASIVIRCEDGTTYNVGANSSTPALTKALPMPSSSCAAFERAVKETKAQMEKSPTSEMQARLKYATTKWEECRRKNMNAATVCKEEKDTDGCVVKTCSTNGVRKVMSKTCPQ